jgi:2-oxoglutarate dehydrogenase E1 component
MKDFSYITSSHPAYIENLYQDFIKDPNSVDPEMKKFFEGFDFAVSNAAINGANGKHNGTETIEAPVAAENKTCIRRKESAGCRVRPRLDEGNQGLPNDSRL